MFTALHDQPFPLLLANVWDASSALAAEHANFQAIGTSSAALADLLGYPDGEAMPFTELLYMVERIKSVTRLPLSVDIEAGYGNNIEQIIDNIQRLMMAGVVGINIEDSHCINGIRQLDDATIFAAKLQNISTACPDIFINARSDAFLLGIENAREETLRRGKLYATMGANGFFVPGVHQRDDIEIICQQVALPLNVMHLPQLPDLKTLTALGVKRVSMGNALHVALQQQLQAMFSRIQTTQDLHGI